LSTTTTEKSVGMDGTSTKSTGTTYRDSNGVASDSTTTTATYPPPAVLSTDRSTTTTTTR
jgi:hypothetical protein